MCLMVLALLIGSFFSLVVDLAQPNRAFASGTSWSPPSAIDGAMVSVSCPTASFCMAVDSNGRVLHFNGTTWAAPLSIDGSNYLSSVSCPTVTFCMAVDRGGNALSFNGTTWAAPLSIDGTHSLYSVSCPTVSLCKAVDGSGNALSFNGSTWAAPLSVDSTNEISSISCPTTSFCMAVDGSGKALGFNGSTWATPSLIDSVGYFTSLSCPTASFCMATDNFGDVLNFNGTTWAAPTVLDVADYLSSVSCTSATLCIVVTFSGKTFTFNGTTWTGPVVIDGGRYLSSISCPTTTFCMAVDNSGYALSFNSTTWASAVEIDGSNIATSVSCPTTTFCMAVDNSGNAIIFNGSTWAAPVSVGSVNALISVSCASASFCMAVGLGGKAYSFNGSTWAAPVSTGSGYYLESVSCPTVSFCVAVDGNGNALRYNGSTWAAPVSIDGTNEIYSVSCATTSFCMAIDNAGNAISFDGSTWAAPVSIDASYNIASVSCVATSFCIDVDSTGKAIRYNGTSWSTPVSIDGTKDILSVSCATTSFCMAIDNAGNAISFDGSTWAAPVSIDASYNSNSVSCPTASFCIDVDRNGSALTYSPVASVSSLSPSSGPLPGGSLVTILGSNFTGATSVDFGSTPASSFTVVSDSEITATSPSVAASGLVNVTVTGPDGTSLTSTFDQFNYIQGGTYSALSPMRICDTRANQVGVVTNQCNRAGLGGTLLGNSSLSVNVANYQSDGVPANATAVVVNVTAVGPSMSGYLTLYPAGIAKPSTSSLNFSANEYAVANMVEVPIGVGGAISIYNFMGSVDVLVDVEGYVAPPSNTTPTEGLFNPITPYRIADTRSGASDPATYANETFSAGQSRSFQISGTGTGSDIVPSSDVSAVVLNVTATNTSSNGFISVSATAPTSTPTFSDINYSTSMSVPNRVIVPLSPTGSISIYSSQPADIIVDVSGWFTLAPTGATGDFYFPITPARIADSRTNSTYQDQNKHLAGGSPIGLGTPDQVNVVNINGDQIPTSATAVVGNLTVTNAPYPGFMTAWPANSSAPNTSDLNWSSNETVPNALVVPISPGGVINIAANSSCDFIVDASGYYAS